MKQKDIIGRWKTTNHFKNFGQNDQNNNYKNKYKRRDCKFKKKISTKSNSSKTTSWKRKSNGFKNFGQNDQKQKSKSKYKKR